MASIYPLPPYCKTFPYDIFPIDMNAIGDSSVVLKKSVLKADYCQMTIDLSYLCFDNMSGV